MESNRANNELRSNAAIMASAVIPALATNAALEIGGHAYLKNKYGTMENASNKSRYIYEALYGNTEDVKKQIVEKANEFGPKKAESISEYIDNSRSNTKLGSKILGPDSGKKVEKMLDSKTGQLLLNGISTKAGRMNAYGITALTGAIGGAYTIANKGEKDSSWSGAISGAAVGVIGAEAGIRYKTINGVLDEMKKETGERGRANLNRFADSLKIENEGTGIKNFLKQSNQATVNMLKGVNPEFEKSTLGKMTGSKAARWGVRGAAGLAAGTAGLAIDALQTRTLGEKL